MQIYENTWFQVFSPINFFNSSTKIFTVKMYSRPWKYNANYNTNKYLYYRSMPRLRDIWKVSLQRAKGTCSTSVSCNAWVISFLSHVLQLGILKLFWEGKRKRCKFSNFAKTLILCLITSQLIFTCWKSTTETLEKGVKYVQS